MLRPHHARHASHAVQLPTPDPSAPSVASVSPDPADPGNQVGLGLSGVAGLNGKRKPRSSAGSGSDSEGGDDAQPKKAAKKARVPKAKRAAGSDSDGEHLRRGEHKGTPPAGPFTGAMTVQILPLVGADGPVTSRILLHCQRSFFREDDGGEWIIYRRNYIHLKAAVELLGPLDDPVEEVAVKTDDGEKRIEKWWVEVRAVDARNANVELVQCTSKRDFGPTSKPEPVQLVPGGDPFREDDVSRSKKKKMRDTADVAIFYRFQFRHASSHNPVPGSKPIDGNTFSLLVDLLGSTPEGELLHIAQVHSMPLVVRGRSPSHYAKRKLSQTGKLPRPSVAPAVRKDRGKKQPSPRSEGTGTDAGGWPEGGGEADGEGSDVEAEQPADWPRAPYLQDPPTPAQDADPMLGYPTPEEPLSAALRRGSEDGPIPFPEPGPADVEWTGTGTTPTSAPSLAGLPSRFFDPAALDALVPGPISTAVPAGGEDASAGGSGSGSGSKGSGTGKLLSAASLWIDWSGGKPQSA
ncbi:hypothetical protein DFJ74DRAFT_657561 [Hyaloraphidium curvatum]|nr:hypothetical protein DFJ74DRAFT_657561 [Hyaloraphidium curvatum]